MRRVNLAYVEKMTKSPFNKKGERASDLLGLIHTDVCGPLSTSAIGGYSYFVTFTDDFSRYGYVYLMKLSRKLLKSSKSLKTKYKTNLAKALKPFDPIEVVNT